MMNSTVPLEFLGETDEECRAAMESMKKYLIAAAGHARKAEPKNWKEYLDSRWDELITTWSMMTGYKIKLNDGGAWEVMCSSRVKTTLH